MDALRLPDGDRDVTTLSGGERRAWRSAACSSPRPTCSSSTSRRTTSTPSPVAWLERFLEAYKGTVIAVTHDRYFLDNVAGWILELDRGKGIPFQGNYSSWLEQKEARLGVEEKQNAARRRTLQRELEWVRMSPTARHAKSKARLTAYEKLLAEDQAKRLDTVEIHIPAGPRLGDVVVRADDVQKGSATGSSSRTSTFDLPPGGIVGVIGPNGAGKTTLFRMIAGEEKPDGGTLEVGETVELAYVDQSRGGLERQNTVWKEISGNQDVITLGKREVNSRQYVSWFNFRGGDQQKLVKDLSGGERNRVHLAKLLRAGGNLLLLDEPTNDLDVDTLRALEEALVDFAGCAVVISHDRWFLDRVATHILAFEGDSQTTWFEGSYAEYCDWVRETRGPEALEPHRIAYKPLVRPVSDVGALRCPHAGCATFRSPTRAPDTRSPTRLLVWVGRQQLGTLALGIAFGIVWMLAQALMPFTIGRAIQDGIVDDDGRALVTWALLLLGWASSRGPRGDAAPLRRAELAHGRRSSSSRSSATTRRARAGGPRAALDRRGRRDGDERRAPRRRRLRHHRRGSRARSSRTSSSRRSSSRPRSCSG